MPSRNLEDFISRKKKEDKKPGLEVSGSFSCEECDEIVKSAIWDEDSKEITWTCSSNHTTTGRM